MTEDRYARRNRALAFAARAHRKQTRKGTVENPDDLDKLVGGGVPYIMHPSAVGMLLLEYGAPDDAVIAGILHDVIEDTKVTKEVVEREFSSRIAELVTAESEPDKTLPWRERKEHTIRYLAACEDEEIKLVAAADKLHNVQSIKSDLDTLGEEVWKRFNATKEEQSWYYNGICKALMGGDDHPLYGLLRKTVTDVFGAEKGNTPK